MNSLQVVAYYPAYTPLLPVRRAARCGGQVGESHLTPELQMNDRTHAYPKVSAGCLAALLLCFSLVNLSAQTSTAPAVLKPEQVAAPAKKTNTVEEEILQLNPFVVTNSEDRGYSSASTLSGTRLDTPAKFVAAAISEVNKALMVDLGQFNMMELVDFTTNAVAYDNSRTGSFSDYSGQ